jgi:hypothetical protein
MKISPRQVYCSCSRGERKTQKDKGDVDAASLKECDLLMRELTEWRYDKKRRGPTLRMMRKIWVREGEKTYILMSKAQGIG